MTFILRETGNTLLPVYMESKMDFDYTSERAIVCVALYALFAAHIHEVPSARSAGSLILAKSNDFRIQEQIDGFRIYHGRGQCSNSAWRWTKLRRTQR